uniref:Uncharacterized protein n=1 Tax=Gasterosteus aculeatus TaxID=69293 RepID=G3PJS9_GASAC
DDKELERNTNNPDHRTCGEDRALRGGKSRRNPWELNKKSQAESSVCADAPSGDRRGSRHDVSALCRPTRPPSRQRKRCTHSPKFALILSAVIFRHVTFEFSLTKVSSVA